MTTSELLQPRYLCAAPDGAEHYPNSPFEVGEIIILVDTIHPTYDHYSNGVEGVSVDDVLKHPHLFKALPWYHGRAVEDMPEYIRPKDDNSKVHKVKWEKDDLSNSGWCLSVDEPEFWIDACFDNIDIATLSDYEAYKNQTDGTK